MHYANPVEGGLFGRTARRAGRRTPSLISIVFVSSLSANNLHEVTIYLRNVFTSKKTFFFILPTSKICIIHKIVLSLPKFFVRAIHRCAQILVVNILVLKI